MTETKPRWTPAHEDRNPWRREWFAAEPCPDCGECNVIIDCDECAMEHYGVNVKAHECEERAECMTCPWRED